MIQTNLNESILGQLETEARKNGTIIKNNIDVPIFRMDDVAECFKRFVPNCSMSYYFDEYGTGVLRIVTGNINNTDRWKNEVVGKIIGLADGMNIGFNDENTLTFYFAFLNCIEPA